LFELALFTFFPKVALRITEYGSVQRTEINQSINQSINVSIDRQIVAGN
jgi:hypothetical protein